MEVGGAKGHAWSYEPTNMQSSGLRTSPISTCYNADHGWLLMVLSTTLREVRLPTVTAICSTSQPLTLLAMQLQLEGSFGAGQDAGCP